MGLTPLEGLVMGTRPGDVDPGVLLHLLRQGVTGDEIDRLLNRESGIKGLSGVTDLRELITRRDAGDAAATQAFDVYVHRLRKYVGAYTAVLGAVDALTFTAGVGENSAAVRAAVCAGLEPLGYRIDARRNEQRSREARVLSPDGAPVTVLVVPTNEELAIARQTVAAIEHDRTKG
jgi:acetate kinase